MTWTMKAISEICVTGSGTTPPRSESEKYFGGSVPWVKSGELSQGIVTATEESLTEEAIKARSIKVVEPGALLVALYGATVGQVAELGIRATTNQAVCHIVPNPNEIDTRFLFHALKRQVPDWIEMRVGGAQPNISQGIVKATKIPVPPLDEQRRIAAILDKADAIRRKREEGIRLTEELLRSTFLEMFGDPVINPKRWDVIRLGDAIKFVGGSQPPKETFRNQDADGYIRLVQIRDFKSDRYKTFIPESLARRRFEDDDVMIARYGPPVFQILRGLSGSYNVALMKAEPTESTTKSFVFHLLQIPAIHDTVVEHSSRTAGQTGVNLDLLNNLKVPLPPISVQNKIGLVMDRLTQTKLARHRSLQDSNALFDSLVQLAFWGEL